VCYVMELSFDFVELLAKSSDTGDDTSDDRNDDISDDTFDD